MGKSTMTEGRAAGNVKCDLFTRKRIDREQTRQRRGSERLELHPQVDAGLGPQGEAGPREREAHPHGRQL